MKKVYGKKDAYYIFENNEKVNVSNEYLQNMIDTMEAMPKVQVLEARLNGSVATVRIFNGEVKDLRINGKFSNHAKGYYQNMVEKQGVKFEFIKEEYSEEAYKIYELLS